MNGRIASNSNGRIELEGNSIGYLVLSFGLLVIVAWRAFVLGEASWDLLGLVVLAGAVATAYRGWHEGITRPVAIRIVLAVALAILLAVLATTLR